MTNTSIKKTLASSKQQEFDSNFQEDCTPTNLSFLKYNKIENGGIYGI